MSYDDIKFKLEKKKRLALSLIGFMYGVQRIHCVRREVDEMLCIKF